MDDDLLTIRRVLRSGPPTPEATARARDLLTAEIAAAAHPVAVLTPSPRRSWLGRGALLAGGLAALLIAGVIAVPALDGPDHDGPRGDAPAAAPATAQDLLLAAAQKAADTPATSGRYWHVRFLAVGGPIKVGAYDVAGRWLRASWLPGSVGSSWYAELPLGYKPRTPADEEAWRAAGSPTSWTVPPDAVNDVPATYRTTPEQPPTFSEEKPVDKPFRIVSGRFDAAGIAALPTDPAELTKQIAALRPGVPQPYAGWVVYRGLSQLLFEVPAPPTVRAAAFAAMAGVPGVRSVGTVTTPDGRSGTGVELVMNLGDGKTSRHLTVIDPKTYQVLSVEDTDGQPAGPNARPMGASTTVVLVAEWTDTEPAPPKAP
jgi:hypothetical protein